MKIDESLELMAVTSQPNLEGGDQLSKFCILGLKTFLPGEAAKFISRGKLWTWNRCRCPRGCRSAAEP